MPKIEVDDTVPLDVEVDVRLNHHEIVFIMEAVAYTVASASGQLMEAIESSLTTKAILQKFFPIDHTDPTEGSQESSKLLHFSEKIAQAHDLMHKQAEVKTGKVMPS